MTNKLHNLSGFDFSGVLEALEGLPNPEQWHVKMSTHPGIGWSIKTVMPSKEIADPDMVRICDLWTMLGMLYPDMITITDTACDWTGEPIEGWSTIWLADGWDVRITNDGIRGLPSYEISTPEVGIRSRAKEIVDIIQSRLAHSSDADRDSLETLIEACNALISQVSEIDSQVMRKNIRILDE